MIVLVVLVSLPVVAAAIAAVVIRVTALRATPALDARLTAATAFAGALPVIVVVLDLVLRISGVIRVGRDDLAVQAALPLALGAVAMLALMIPPVPRRAPSSASVARRTLLTFAAPRWITAVATLAAVAFGLILALGSASSLDEEGRYTAYRINLGSTGHTGGTDIFGWYYSAPSSALLCLLLILTAIAWLLLPRRPWDSDVDLDTAVRRTRGANIGRAAAGAILVHLAVVLRSAAGTAQLMTSSGSTDLGTVSIGTPFAAIGPALAVLGAVSFAAGLSAWVLIALTAVPRRRRMMTGAA